MPVIHQPLPIVTGVTAQNFRTFISSASASGSASLDFGNLGESRFRYYEFLLFNLVPATDNALLNMRASQDFGSTFDSGANYSWEMRYFERLTQQVQGSASASAITISSNQANLALSNVAAEGGASGWVRCWHMHEEVDMYVDSQIGYSISFDPNRHCGIIGSSNYDQHVVTSGIQFLMSTGNITSGEIFCYGVE
jgi:hypothetical protein